MLRIGTLVSMIVVAVAALTATAAAQDGVLEIPIDTVVREPEGSITLLASVDVPPEAVGLTCTGEATSSNQGSVHPNNDLLVETGGASAVFEDVEDVPGRTITASGSFVLGDTFTVSLRMGSDEVFSGGILIEVDCAAAETTTTVAETTTSAPAATTAPETTTTEPTAPPETSETVPVEETTTSTSAPQTEGDTDQLPNTGSGVTIPALALGAALLGGGLALLSWERAQPQR